MTRLEICSSCEFFGGEISQSSWHCKKLGDSPGCINCRVNPLASTKYRSCPLSKWGELPEEVVDNQPCIHYNAINKNFGRCALKVFNNMPPATCAKCSKRQT